MGKPTLKSLIDSFSLKDAYEASRAIYEREIDKDKTSYKCEKAEQAAKILNGSSNFELEQKQEIAALLSIFTEEEIVIIDNDNSKELHPGIFIKAKEDCGGITKDSVAFISSDDDDDCTGNYEDDGNLESNNYLGGFTEFEHPTFEEVEEFFNKLKDSQKILLISSIIEHQK